jgi:hypothetical protein
MLDVVVRKQTTIQKVIAGANKKLLSKPICKMTLGTQISGREIGIGIPSNEI